MPPIKNFRAQDYIRLQKACLAQGKLFEDPEFPTAAKSLFYSKEDPSIVWKRPKELCKNPKLVVEGVTCDDLKAGELDNMWFVAACASLLQEKKLWQKLVPSHKQQEWDPKNTYVGMFRFNMYRFGQWIEVVVDDRLPTRDNHLIFCHSKSRSEFWSALLEKAYAKLFGDYESLIQGYVVDALVDFTGGVAERLDLLQYDLEHDVTFKKIFQKVLTAAENKALIVCEIKCPKEEHGFEGEFGLILGQGYIITGGALVSPTGTEGPEFHLLRLFNPWEAREWTGPWCDGSKNWRALPMSDWERYGVKFKLEGEFWMAFEDFIHYFTNVEICHFLNTSAVTLKKTWHETLWYNQWTTAGMNGGGEYSSATCLIDSGDTDEPATAIPGDFYKRKFIFKFLYNPQYAFDVTGQHDHIMVSLAQHDLRGREALLGQMKSIGFHILKVENNRRFRVHIPMENLFSSGFANTRSVFGTVKLAKGRYTVLPGTLVPGKVGHFMVRLYTTAGAHGFELRDEAPSLPFPCMARFKCVTSIVVLRCQGLMPPQGHKGSFDTFIAIKCEGERVQSGVCNDTVSPIYNSGAVFYRKKALTIPVTVDIFKKGSIMNEFLAEARCKLEGTESGEFHTLSLHGKLNSKDAAEDKAGSMDIFIRTSVDITLL